MRARTVVLIVLALWLVFAYSIGLFSLASAGRFVAVHVGGVTVILLARYLLSRMA